MSLNLQHPAFSVGISQMPAERHPGVSSMEAETQEPLSAYLPIPQPHTMVQPELSRAENTPAYQQRESQSWDHNENGLAIAESAPENEHSGVFKEENDGEFDEDASNDEEQIDAHGMSISDSTTDKKRMKRFRLTHNQTRFLMSEFTRQAHPDASHRERLSREIPGLSPRQVQVWFQNRRAKLKRLTSQDRDRVLKSRALPDHFDRTKMLHHPYDSKPGSGSSSKSTNSAGSSAARGGGKPLAINTLHIASTDSQSTSNTAAPTYGNYLQSPAQASIPESISPTSNTGNRSAIPGDNASIPGIAGIHQSNFPRYARPHSFSTSYIGSWQQYHTHGLPLQSGDSAMKPDTTNTILRPGMAYTELGGSISETSSYDRNSSLASSTGQSDAQPGLTYHGQSHHVQNERFTPSTQAVTESPGSFSPVSFRPFPPLQTAHIPPAVDYQVSPFTTTFSYDSFYQYGQENASAVSLPASYMRSEASYNSPHGFSS
ncbi:hypothetical protein PISL3812_09841 [Talaromyces islandicus]|uniref:Homeobox domain-containing protein n=1 Tax=Talaromyces islandicus TaxID=28573 RepID=A0A0U1MAX1_TALIS|nr:hypothetical protein PISL3812_09841 [Talaromyces islandicus]